MLTNKQHELLLFIDDRLTSTGVSPSYEEMKVALGLHSKSGIHRLVKALEERGFIRRLPHRARAVEILRLPSDTTGAKAAAVSPAAASATAEPEGANILSGDFSRKFQPFTAQPVQTGIEIPLHGRIAAGTPIEALQNTDNMISVPPSLIGPGSHFALEVEGDSMIDLGIFDGDTAIIKSADVAENGDIVVALVDNEEATLKTLHKRGKQIALKPANPNFSTQILPASRVRIQGRLVGLIRRY